MSRASGRQVGQEHVGRGQQLLHPLSVLGIAEVEDHAALAPVVEGEGRVRHLVADAQGPEHAAHRVAGGRLDLDDLGAPVGQQRGGCRRRHPHAELDDPEVGERAEARRPGVGHVVDAGVAAATRSRSTSFSTLPVAFSGSSSTISTARGTL